MLSWIAAAALALGLFRYADVTGGFFRTLSVWNSESAYAAPFALRIWIAIFGVGTGCVALAALWAAATSRRWYWRVAIPVSAVVLVPQCTTWAGSRAVWFLDASSPPRSFAFPDYFDVFEMILISAFCAYLFIILVTLRYCNLLPIDRPGPEPEAAEPRAG
jgi:hypothetical protein